jgi:hypothetical protein
LAAPIVGAVELVGAELPHAASAASTTPQPSLDIGNGLTRPTPFRTELGTLGVALL